MPNPLLFIAAATVPLSLGGNSVLLRYKFHTGQTIKYAMNLNMRMLMNIGGKGMPMNVASANVNTETVKSVGRDGTALLDMKVANAKSTMNGKPSNLMSTANVTGGSLRMSPRGDVSDINVPSARGSASNLGAMQMSGQLPSGPVHAGSVWTSSFKIPQLGATTMRNRVERVSRSNGKTLVFIGGQGTMDLGKLAGVFGAAKGLKGGAGGANIKYEMIFDATAGLLRSSVANVNYSLKMKMGSGAQAKAITTSGTQKMTMTLLSG